jgi:citrate lyase beta subunit
MVLISNHLIQEKIIKPPKDAVIRVNLAWVQDEQRLKECMDTEHQIFLDYPYGRAKPPQPTWTIEESVSIANSYQVVKYYAISNAEEPFFLQRLRESIRSDVIIIPKIETSTGVDRLGEITEAAETEMVMIDKEDLFMNIKYPKAYLSAMATLRTACAYRKIQILAIAGVVFST